VTLNSSAKTGNLMLLDYEVTPSQPAIGSQGSFSLTIPFGLSLPLPFVMYTPAAERYSQLRREIVASGLSLLDDDELREEIKSRRSDREP